LTHAVTQICGMVYSSWFLIVPATVLSSVHVFRLPKVMLCMDTLAQCCEKCGDDVAAKLSYEQALAGYEGRLGRTHLTYVVCHRRYVELLKRAQDVAHGDGAIEREPG
jgi:hypothetical protein